MKKALYVLLVLIAVVATAFFLGPKPAPAVYSEDLPVITLALKELEDSVNTFELNTGALECAYTEILWADSIRQTDYVFLYLHGFSATKHEGDTLRYMLPKRYGMNALYNRMAGHGLDEADAERMSGFSAEEAWNKALYDFALAKKLGKQVIIGSCSTGSLLALRLAAKYPEDIAALINYSPNMGLPDPNSALLNGPWGLQIIKAISGTAYRIVPEREDGIHSPCKPMSYSWESVVEMQHLVETAVTPELLASVTTPTLNMVWFEDQDHQDYVIDVEKARKMHEQLSGKKVWVETAAREHVVLNHLLSSDLKNVYAHTFSFMDEIVR
jgi:esterase/lipase